MNTNKQAYNLEEISNSIDLMCEYVTMLIRSNRFDVQLDKHLGMIASLEYCAGTLDTVAKEHGININYVPVDRA